MILSPKSITFRKFNEFPKNIKIVSTNRIASPWFQEDSSKKYTNVDLIDEADEVRQSSPESHSNQKKPTKRKVISLNQNQYQEQESMKSVNTEKFNIR